MRLSSCIGVCVMLLSPCLRAETAAIAPKTPEAALDGAFVVTEQSPTLDWWAKVPANTSAQVTPVKKVYRGQTFFLIPFVVGYTLGDNHQFDLSYSLVKVAPDASREQILKDSPIRGRSSDARMLQAPLNFPGGVFEDSDPYGTYRFTLQMKDARSGAIFEKESAVELSPWKRPADDMFTAQQLQTGHFEYYATRDPDWLWVSFLSDEVSLEQSGSPQGLNMVLLSFYKNAFAQYDFLVPRLDEAFAQATPVQRLKIILLYALLDKPQLADDRLSPDERAYQQQMRAWTPPSPHTALDKPEDVEWLWGEFFATGDYKPVRRLCEALALIPYAREPERVLKQKDAATADDLTAFWKGKTFSMLMRSAMVYGAKSPLARQYFGYVLENEPLPPDSRTLLLAVMRKLWPERYVPLSAEAPAAAAGAGLSTPSEDEGPL